MPREPVLPELPRAVSVLREPCVRRVSRVLAILPAARVHKAADVPELLAQRTRPAAAAGLQKRHHEPARREDHG